jgi:hypothetical protein
MSDPDGLCCKKSRDNTMDVLLLLLLGLSRHSKQAGYEGDLPGDVSFAHTSHLSLAKHVHHLIPLSCPPCRFNRKEAHPRLDQPLEKTVV